MDRSIYNGRWLLLEHDDSITLSDFGHTISVKLFEGDAKDLYVVLDMWLACKIEDERAERLREEAE